MKRGFLDSDPGSAKHGKTEAGGSAGGTSPQKQPPQETEAAKQAFAQLKALLEYPRGRENLPNMDWMWEDDYEEEVLQSVKEALSAGVGPAKVQQTVFRVAKEELGSVPSKIQKAILEKLTPDSDVGGQSFLHQQFRQTFPPTVEEDVGVEWGEDLISLPELLRKNPTRNLQDSKGDTILHILIRNTMDGTYFPDDSTTGSMYSGDIERWDERAQYFEDAFKMLLDAGWSVQVRNRKGASVLDLLKAAKRKAESLVNDHGVKSMAQEFASIPWMQAAGRETVGKVVKDRQRMLQALSKVIDLATKKQSA